MKTLEDLMATMPQRGVVDWIGLRPAQREPIRVVASVEANTREGLVGDRYSGRTGKRHVTLIQAEHLGVIAACLGRDRVSPEQLRRNVVVRGINLLALEGKQMSIGSVVLAITGKCHPCSYMETVFGPGGYNAVRGHGGVTAQVISGGSFALGDPVALEPKS